MIEVLCIDSKQSSGYELFVYGMGVFSAILSSVFINFSLQGLLKELTGLDTKESLSTATRTILVDESLSIAVGFLCIFFLDSFNIYDVANFGFILTSMAYCFYYILVKFAHKSVTDIAIDAKIKLVIIIRAIYSIGNTLTLAVIFSSVHHVFKQTGKGRGIGSTIYGIISIIAAIISSLGLSRLYKQGKLSISSSYLVLFFSQLINVIIITASRRAKKLKSTKQHNENNGIIKNAKYSIEFLKKNTLSKWLALIASISLGWAARATSLAAYSYVEMTLTEADYPKFMAGHGISQLLAACWYALLMGVLVRRYQDKSSLILLIGVGLPGLICGIISYGSFAISTNESGSPFSPLPLGLLAGTSQIAIVLYQMAFISAVVSSESDLLSDEKANGVRSAVVGLSSLFGSLATFTMSLIAETTRIKSEDPKTSTIQHLNTTTPLIQTPLGLAQDSTSPSSTQNASTSTVLNRKSFYVIAVPCAIGFVSDIGYHIASYTGTKEEDSTRSFYSYFC